jgi:hypothetical protein
MPQYVDMKGITSLYCYIAYLITLTSVDGHDNGRGHEMVSGRDSKAPNMWVKSKAISVTGRGGLQGSEL